MTANKRIRRSARHVPRVRFTPISDGNRPKGRAPLRAEFRKWRAALPTPLERDTWLVSDWIAETVVLEAERFLRARLPEDFAERLAAKAFHLYPRHKHFHKMLNRP